MTTSRRLAAIVATDVVGYSRLMGVDEEGTRAAMRKLRDEVWEPKAEQFGGRIVKTTGDGQLLEFVSVVDALKYSVELQQGMAERNKDVAEDKRIELRVGINLGDVIVEGDDIHGDGVNIAARLEGLSDPGGVCVSGPVYDQVKNKIELEFSDLGPREVKNIAEPVRVYSVAVRLQTPAATLQLPDKPSIAVLPFENMSGDPEQEYFSDGISEDIITALSKISDLFVIARNSSFAYRGKATNAKDICRDLGVRYLLEGSVRKAGDRIRVTAQLIDGTTGGHLWADRFDRQLKDIFDLQDEVTAEIVSALEVKLTPSQRTLLTQKDTTVAEAHDYLLRGRELQYRQGKETNLEARAMFERAAELDPSSATAVALVGGTYMVEWFLSGSGSEADTFSRAYGYAQDALRLDNSVAAPHRLMGQVHLYGGSHDLAILEIDRAMALDPNDSEIYVAKSFALSWAGHPEDALASIEVGMSLNPRYPPMFLMAEGAAYFGMHKWTDAIGVFNLSIERNPNFINTHIWLAASLGIIDRIEEARKSCSEVLRLNPSFTIAEFRRKHESFQKRESDLNHLCDGLRKAGLPE